MRRRKGRGAVGKEQQEDQQLPCVTRTANVRSSVTMTNLKRRLWDEFELISVECQQRTPVRVASIGEGGGKLCCFEMARVRKAGNELEKTVWVARAGQGESLLWF